MKIVNRNSRTIKWDGQSTVESIISFVLMAEEYGWLLDEWAHTNGISMTSEGIFINFCKMSDKHEEMPVDEIKTSTIFNSYKQSQVKDRSKVKDEI